MSKRWKDVWPSYEGTVRVVGEFGEARYGWACADQSRNPVSMSIIMYDSGERESHKPSMAYRKDLISSINKVIEEYVETEVSLNGGVKLGPSVLPDSLDEVKSIISVLEKTFNVGPIQSQYPHSPYGGSVTVRILSRK